MAKQVVISPKEAPFSVSGPSEEQGFTFEQRDAAENTVYRVDADENISPSDGSVVLVDTSGSTVTLTIDPIPAGSSFKVINESGDNTVEFATASGLNITDAEGVTPLDAAAGDMVQLIHSVGGDVYAHGDAIA